MNEIIKQFFDSIAFNYKHDDSKLIDDLLNSIKLSGCHRILDLGCGKGISSQKLVELNHGEVVALDLSSKMIELAKEKINDPRVTFINGDFYEFKSSPFDAIICFDAFPHFLDVPNFVKKAHGLLKKDGLLAIIHDIGRPSLNKHHEAHALKVSRLLDTPEKEKESFLKYFTPIELYESEECYKMIYIKKGD